MRYALVTPEELASIKIEAMETSRDLKDVLIERGAVSEDALLYAVSSELGIPFVTLEPNSIDRDLFRTLPVEVLKRYRFLPMIEVDR
ncbi:hypothetical protein BMS3Bbin06_02172 [bacterium BMS3Bbin06]|nr:hypothetical protein BMS3Abin08_00346 [bacterium BMS3Abin08]GBE35629.1 hypothetical protein BMS3Bbin06_02172 [bacterium BMS3Bbin06]HDO34897.1 hypothetical protein [Nitrospirota bacterium]HDY71632.1 hypothetical protein [Nitrospirota bacterium]